MSRLLAFTLVLLASLGIYAVTLLRRRRSAFARLPPGPRPHLLFGNKIPKFSWRYYHRLSQEYGPLVTVWEGLEPVVICNSMRTANDLLEKHARDTADRPRTIVAGETASGNKRILLVGYSDRWRRLRKALHNQLQPQAARDFQPMQRKAARALIQDVLDEPDSFLDHIRTYASSIVLSMAYGGRGKVSYSHPDVRQVVKCSDNFMSTLKPGAWKVESFPLLRYVPGYLAVPKDFHQQELNLYRHKLKTARQAIARGDDLAPNFAEYISQHQAEFELSDDEVAALCGSLFLAGSDTSSSAIAIAVMAAAQFPEMQKQVQAELDSVIGRNRLPEFEDEDELPVVQAFIRETYRWRPVSSGGFQHATTADIAYGNFVIPAGTRILGNHWAIHRDPELFADPETFDLNRWLIRDTVTAEAKLNPTVKHVQFGFGRRVCPGQHVANRSLFINTALLLWAFDIQKKQTSTGQVIDIDVDAFTSTANSHPLPFQVEFVQRVSNITEMLGSP